MMRQELKRLGADIDVEGNAAIVKGVAKLTGANVMATDLRRIGMPGHRRARGEGQTTIDRIYHLDRGYDASRRKLRASARASSVSNESVDDP
jgi:UDP-N-acetylglucosamine 1-carboxyvinyltransferase